MFTDPGYFEKEYSDLFSLTKFLKYFFHYILKHKSDKFSLSSFIKDSKPAEIYEDLIEIIELKKELPEIKDKYSSNDKENIFNEIEQYECEKDKATISQILNEDILEAYEREFSDFTKDEVYSKYLKISFMIQNKSNSRICTFCLTKKVKYI